MTPRTFRTIGGTKSQPSEPLPNRNEPAAFFFSAQSVREFARFFRVPVEPLDTLFDRIRAAVEELDKRITSAEKDAQATRTQFVRELDKYRAAQQQPKSAPTPNPHDEPDAFRRAYM